MSWTYTKTILNKLDGGIMANLGYSTIISGEVKAFDNAPVTITGKGVIQVGYDTDSYGRVTIDNGTPISSIGRAYTILYFQESVKIENTGPTSGQFNYGTKYLVQIV